MRERAKSPQQFALVLLVKLVGDQQQFVGKGDFEMVALVQITRVHHSLLLSMRADDLSAQAPVQVIFDATYVGNLLPVVPQLYE